MARLRLPVVVIVVTGAVALAASGGCDTKHKAGPEHFAERLAGQPFEAGVARDATIDPAWIRPDSVLDEPPRPPLSRWRFGPRGHWIAARGDDGRCRLWHQRTGAYAGEVDVEAFAEASASVSASATAFLGADPCEAWGRPGVVVSPDERIYAEIEGPIVTLRGRGGEAVTRLGCRGSGCDDILDLAWYADYVDDDTTEQPVEQLALLRHVKGGAGGRDALRVEYWSLADMEYFHSFLIEDLEPVAEAALGLSPYGRRSWRVIARHGAPGRCSAQVSVYRGHIGRLLDADWGPTREDFEHEGEACRVAVDPQARWVYAQGEAPAHAFTRATMESRVGEGMWWSSLGPPGAEFRARAGWSRGAGAPTWTKLQSWRDEVGRAHARYQVLRTGSEPELVQRDDEPRDRDTTPSERVLLRVDSGGQWMICWLGTDEHLGAIPAEARRERCIDDAPWALPEEGTLIALHGSGKYSEGRRDFALYIDGDQRWRIAGEGANTAVIAEAGPDRATHVWGQSGALAVMVEGEGLHLLRGPSGRERVVREPKIEHILHARLEAEVERVLARRRDGAWVVYDLAQAKALFSPRALVDWTPSMAAFDPRGERLALGDGRRVAVVDLGRGGASLAAWELDEAFRGLAWRQDGAALFTAHGVDAPERAWDPETGAPAPELAPVLDPATLAAGVLDPGWRWLATGDGRLIRVSDGASLRVTRAGLVVQLEDETGARGRWDGPGDAEADIAELLEQRIWLTQAHDGVGLDLDALVRARHHEGLLAAFLSGAR